MWFTSLVRLPGLLLTEPGNLAMCSKDLIFSAVQAVAVAGQQWLGLTLLQQSIYGI